MPQARERSLATPMIRPFLPAMSGCGPVMRALLPDRRDHSVQRPGILHDGRSPRKALRTLRSREFSARAAVSHHMRAGTARRRSWHAASLSGLLTLWAFTRHATARFVRD